MTAVLRREAWGVGTHDNCRIYLMGDFQWGSRATDERAAAAAIARAANDPAARVVLMGDLIDAIPRNDRKRYNEASYSRWLYGVSDPVGVQVEYAIEQLRPLAEAGKLDAVLTGNHEDRAGQDAHRAIVRGLKQLAGLPFTAPLSLDYAGWLRYVWYGMPHPRRENARKLTMYLNHGAGSGGKGGGAAVNRLNEMASYRDADIVAIGHTHHLIARPAVREVLDRGDNVREQRVWTINTGSFLRGRSDGAGATYSERAAMQPLAAGYAIVHVQPHHNDGVSVRVELVAV